jgi:putative transposase
MSLEFPIYRKYDHRLRNLIATSKDPYLLPHIKIPLSTRRSWVRKGPVEVVTMSEFDLNTQELLHKVAGLEKQLLVSKAESTLTSKSIKIMGFELQYKRIPKSVIKESILAQIKEASEFLSIGRCLEIVGLSSARYYSWIKSRVACALEDVPSCPKITPCKITYFELRKMKAYLTDASLFHISITSLSWLAKRRGDVFASASTWSRVVRDNDLKRKRQRIYPASPKLGIRASFPGQIWHLDMSVMRLQNGKRCYVQAIIDNKSRYVLAWKVSEDFGGVRTKELLWSALKKSKKLGVEVVPTVWVDSGTENLNSNVSSLVNNGEIVRTVAQVEVEQSNSMIEALFHRLKNRYLYYQNLRTYEELVKHVDFYLKEANASIPFEMLGGATPLEVYSGMADNKFSNQLTTGTAQARISRMTFNRSQNCGRCPA